MASTSEPVTSTSTPDAPLQETPSSHASSTTYRSYQSIAGQEEQSVEDRYAIELMSTSRGKLASMCVFTIQLVIAVIILCFFGVSGTMRDVSEPGLIIVGMTACTVVVLVAPALGLVAWDASKSSDSGPGITVTPSERKFQHLIVALLYGLSITLLLLVGNNQQTVLNIVCVVLGSMSCGAHLLFAIVLFIKRT